VAILAEKGEVCEIDTLLLSCRVIGRTVETAFLSKLADEARTVGAVRLEGWFLPTKKNAPAKDFYAQHGFEVATETPDGTRWAFDLSKPARCPDWIRFL
jgi:predicted enzyme involved in methoxymalonyl-ACP biosynthesis